MANTTAPKGSDEQKVEAETRSAPQGRRRVVRRRETKGGDGGYGKLNGGIKEGKRKADADRNGRKKPSNQATYDLRLLVTCGLSQDFQSQASACVTRRVARSSSRVRRRNAGPRSFLPSFLPLSPVSFQLSFLSQYLLQSTLSSLNC